MKSKKEIETFSSAVLYGVRTRNNVASFQMRSCKTLRMFVFWEIFFRKTSFKIA